MIPVVQRTYRELPIALIDEPAYLMRSVVENEAFVELKDDISRNGVQVALIVEGAGERFRLAAGMRRLKAAKALGAVTVPCDIREPGELDAEAIKVLENDIRENANAAETAAYLMRLFIEKCHSDVDEVCALVKRSRQYVEDRLILFQGDEQVFEALRAGRIGLGVALQLNLITDGTYREMYLDDALKFGMTKAAATDLRRRANRAVQGQTPEADTSSAASAASVQPTPAGNVCHVCRRDDHQERMRWLPVHEHCELVVLERVLADFRAALVAGDGA